MASGLVRFSASAAPTSLELRDDAMYREMVEDCLLVHDLGFDAVWFAEHAFTDYMPHPSPLLTMAHVAALVPELSLGAAVLVLPWYTPMRLAGEISMLSALTRGKLLLGIGRGTGRWEYDNYGVDMNGARAALNETYALLEKALGGEPFTFAGERSRHVRPVRVRPAPSPDATIRFFGAVGSSSGAENVAGLGLPLLCHSQSTDEQLADTIQRWSRRTRELAQPVAPSHVIQVRVLLADTDEEARALARAHYPRGFEVQRAHYFNDPDPWRGIPEYEEFASALDGLARMREPEHLEPYLDRQFVGSAETAARRLLRYLDMGFEHVIVHGSTPGLPAAIRRDSYRRFARDVAPRFDPEFKPRWRRG